MDESAEAGLTKEEHRHADELAAPLARVIPDVIRREGEHELERPFWSLFWSGLAGGVSIMASVIGEGALRQKLPPDLPGRDLIADAGYTLGFVIVVLVTGSPDGVIRRHFRHRGGKSAVSWNGQDCNKFYCNRGRRKPKFRHEASDDIRCKR